MRIWIFIFIFTISASAARADYNNYVEQKRQDAIRQKNEFMQEIQRKQANPDALLTSLNQKATPQTASFKAASNGHYYVPATLNGKATVNFIADTGATSVFLTQNDAKTAGIDTQNLNYDHVYNTANGQVRAAETSVRSLKVGGIEIEDMPVAISSQKSGQSLLGMAFFERLNRYGVQDNILSLYK